MNPAPQVRMLLDGVMKTIGVGNRCRFVWMRTGGNLELIGGTPDFSKKNFLGPLGKFTLASDKQVLPVFDPQLEYQLLSSGRWKVNASCEIESPEDDGKASSAQPVGSIGIGTAFGLLSIVWALLHPRVTLNLPSVIECDLMLKDADTLLVDFVTPPTVTCVFGFSFTCRPYRAVLEPNRAGVEYKALILNRSQEWTW